MQQHSPTDPTGARPNDAVLFVALELSRASWLVAIQGTPPVSTAAGLVDGSETV